jgi:hypothetical protein
MFIEVANGELDYETSAFREKSGGSDGQRTYILLERGELCNPCLKNPRMQELGIEKISFQVYQLAEKKLFNMDFKVAANDGRMVYLHFPNKVASENGCLEFFSEVESAASNAGAVGLATLANQATALASQSQFPPHLDSAYFRCMADCDKIELEIFTLLCYLICEISADKTPGS